MPAPREWPNKAKDARDLAAEEVAEAERHAAVINTILLKLIQNGGQLTGEDRLRIYMLINNHLLELIKHQNNALRRLESVGAPTRPISS